MRRIDTWSVVWMCLWGFACGSSGSPAAPTQGPSASVPRGSRLLSIDVTEAENGDFNRAFEVARSAGMEVTTLSLPWDEVEHAPGVYANSFPAIANIFYSQANVAVSLTLAPLDTNNRRLPDDLEGRRFDDPEVIERFNGTLDWVLSEMPDLNLTVLAIGNEIDGSLSDPDEWAQYRRFFEATAAHARQQRPGLRVGAKAMYGGLTGQAQGELVALNALTDVVLATYYPLEGDFAPRDPSVVGPDLDRLAALYPGKPLMLLEAGYPSGGLCGGSEEKQAAFVREIFRWWDSHPRQLEIISFTWLTDIPESGVLVYGEYYGVDSSCFAEYLRTLGLRTSSGSGADKAAFRELKAQAAARGWPIR